MDGLMTSAEAAARLGVKVSTLYVYVSRGLLESQRAPDGRRSLFRSDDVERLARRSRGGRSVESRMAVVTTALTELRAEGHTYRGRSAIELADRATPEQVADLLWDTEPGSWVPVRLPDAAPPTPRDRLPWAVVMAAAQDPLRDDLRPVAVVRAARRLVATLAMGATADAAALPDDAPLASRLATACWGPEPEPARVDALRAAMVLLADHELATSTLAVRVAASTWADPYDAVLAGLGTLAGSLHGSASTRVVDLLRRADAEGAAPAVAELLRWNSAVPGFGHGAYPEGDPRCAALLPRVVALADGPRRQVVDDLLGLAADAELPAPNIDVALGVLGWCTDMDPAWLSTVFAVSRCTGWIAHYLEELAEPPLRFRARAVHVTR
jgi:citrate synthase